MKRKRLEKLPSLHENRTISLPKAKSLSPKEERYLMTQEEQLTTLPERAKTPITLQRQAASINLLPQENIPSSSTRPSTTTQISSASNNQCCNIS